MGGMVVTITLNAATSLPLMVNIESNYLLGCVYSSGNRSRLVRLQLRESPTGRYTHAQLNNNLILK